MVLHGIRIVLQTYLMDIVGSARDGAQLLELVDHHDCDAVLTDLSMPGWGASKSTVMAGLSPWLEGVSSTLGTTAR